MTVDYTDFDEVAHQDKMHFYYDAQSRPAKVEFNGTVYTYLYNLQGDIVGILDNTGTLAVEYQYDAWGRSILTCTLKTEYEPLAKRNPFQYRGYVYDEETELYDLRSRYYNPGWKRFINADEIVYGKLLCANVYTYCQNRPVSKIDKTGKIAVVVGWLASGGWTLGLSALKAAGAYALKLLGVGAAAGIAATGMKHISQSVSSSNADERADVQPLPGPAPTYSATPAPKTTLAPNSAPKLPDYPGDDPEVAPEGYEWRGRGPQGSPEGNYHNPTTGESLHPDLNHAPPIGPHWDYWGPDGVKVRIFPPT